MSRQEQDREDILREATALVDRLELWTPRDDEPIIVGFRRDGGISFYFGSDPVAQFNPQGELRRAYLQGRLIKAVQGKLVAMDRVREANSTVLLSRELNAEQVSTLCDQLRSRMNELHEALQSGMARFGREVSETGSIRMRVLEWLVQHPGELAIAKRPHSGG